MEERFVKRIRCKAFDPWAVSALFEQDKAVVRAFPQERLVHPLSRVGIGIAMDRNDRASYCAGHAGQYLLFPQLAGLVPDTAEDIVLAVERFVLVWGRIICIGAGQEVSEPGEDPVPRRSAVNLDSVETVSVGLLVERIGRLSDKRMRQVCSAFAVATDCR